MEMSVQNIQSWAVPTVPVRELRRSVDAQLTSCITNKARTMAEAARVTYENSSFWQVAYSEGDTLLSP